MKDQSLRFFKQYSLFIMGFHGTLKHCDNLIYEALKDMDRNMMIITIAHHLTTQSK